MKTSHKILIAVLAIVVLGLLARYVVFKEKFEEWGAGLERIEQWQADYKRDHPNATEAEMDAAFEASIADIKVWKEQYKRENPGATDADADAAFEAAWR
jgi:hypothetical protein